MLGGEGSVGDADPGIRNSERIKGVEYPEPRFFVAAVEPAGTAGTDSAEARSQHRGAGHDLIERREHGLEHAGVEGGVVGFDDELGAPRLGFAHP